MKPLLAAFTGVSLSMLVAIEAVALIAQGGVIGPGTGVSSILVIQLGALVAAVVLIIKFGMYLEEWRRTLTKASQFAKVIEKLDARMDQAEERLAAHDKHLASLRLLVQDHEARFGRGDPFSKIAIDEAAG